MTRKWIPWAAVITGAALAVAGYVVGRLGGDTTGRVVDCVMVGVGIICVGCVIGDFVGDNTWTFRRRRIQTVWTAPEPPVARRAASAPAGSETPAGTSAP